MPPFGRVHEHHLTHNLCTAPTSTKIHRTPQSSISKITLTANMSEELTDAERAKKWPGSKSVITSGILEILKELLPEGTQFKKINRGVDFTIIASDLADLDDETKDLFKECYKNAISGSEFYTDAVIGSILCLIGKEDMIYTKREETPGAKGVAWAVGALKQLYDLSPDASEVGGAFGPQGGSDG